MPGAAGSCSGEAGRHDKSLLASEEVDFRADFPARGARWAMGIPSWHETVPSQAGPLYPGALGQGSELQRALFHAAV